MHFNFKKNKDLDSFRKALTVPLIICILVFIPDLGIKETFEWLEQKCLDFLFTNYYLVHVLTFNDPLPSSPTAVIDKNQSFQDFFKRNVNRTDFANLLNILNKQNVKIAAFDFIFDEPKPDEDEVFIKALDDFSYPILGYSYVGGQGRQSLSYVDIYDSESNMVTNVVKLYRPIADKAVARGLLNIPTALDSTVRYAPLAFHLDSDRPDIFSPTLGFSTWVISLLSEKENHLNKLDISKCSNIEEVFTILNKNRPYEFKSVGHKGLDKAISSIENRFLYKFFLKKYPNLKPLDKDKYLPFFLKQEENNTKTWVRLPDKPFPLVGSYEIPCIRLPFQKQYKPFKGDGIEVFSMTRLLPDPKSENSSSLFNKKKITLGPDELIQKIRPINPEQKKGTNTFYGEIKRINNKPISDALVLALKTDTDNHYWEKTKTNTEGKYRLENIPEGNYIISVFIPTENGCDKAEISILSDRKEKEVPLLLLDENTNSVEIPSDINIRSNQLDLTFYGEIIPSFKSNIDGNTILNSIPKDFYLAAFEDNSDSDEEQIYSINNEGKLLLNNTICPNTPIAVLPTETDEEGNEINNWNMHYYRKISIKKGIKAEINNLPTSLNTIVKASNNKTLLREENKIEIEIKPGIQTKISELPRVFRDLTVNVNLKVSFIKNSTNSKVILISDSGKEYEIENEASIDISSGNYLALTQSGDYRGLHQSETVDKKVVFIGTSMPTDQDFVNTPINFLDGGFPNIAGVHIHANLFTALSENRFINAPFFHMDRSPNIWPLLQFLLVLPILVILNIKLKNVKSTKGSLIILLIVSIIFIASVILFPHRIIIPVFYPSFLIVIFGISRGFIEWINFRRQANETQSAFSRFISADVVSQIVNNPDSIKPGGEKKDLTIMFTDIAGFTSISEKLDAESLTNLMNNYLDEMTKILFKNGGTLDKYVGDAIMGFWNHPTPQEDHATRAVCCAIEMQKKLKEMRENWIAQGLPKVEMRAGINSGVCMVGFIGSTIQMNFTCLGDNVNLASRLEGANKAYGTFIMISEPVKKQLNPYLFSIRFLDFLAVKGKNEPVLVYEIRGFLNEENPLWLEKADKIYQEGIDKYLARKWDNAISLFNQVLELFPDDSPSKVYIDRCEHFKDNPPEEKWDGRFILKTK